MKCFLKFFIICCASSTIMFSSVSATFAIEDTILAVVNDDVITFRDLSTFLNTIYTKLKVEGRSDNEISHIMRGFSENGIKKIIEDRLILSLANEMGMQINEAALEERYQSIKDRYPSDKAFMEALINDGANVTELRKKIEEDLKKKYLIEREVKSKVVVNPYEITDYYNAHKDDFFKAEQFDLDSIYISTEGGREAAETRIDEAYNLLEEGQAFEKVAENYSEIPSLGLIQKGQLLPEIDNVISQLKIGEYSKIIEVGQGFYILKLKEKLPPQQATLNEVKDQIRNYLTQVKYQDKYQEWIEKLEKDAYIEIKK